MAQPLAWCPCAEPYRWMKFFTQGPEYPREQPSCTKEDSIVQGYKCLSCSQGGYLCDDCCSAEEACPIGGSIGVGHPVQPLTPRLVCGRAKDVGLGRRARGQPHGVQARRVHRPEPHIPRQSCRQILDRGTAHLSLKELLEFITGNHSSPNLFCYKYKHTTIFSSQVCILIWALRAKPSLKI